MVPEGWKEVFLGDVIDHRKGFAFNSSDFKPEGIRIIRISDTTRNSIHSENPVFLSEADAKGLEKYILAENDIILSTVGSRPHLVDSMVGKAVKIPKSVDGSLLNQNLVKLAPQANKLTREFLYEMLKKQRFIFYISTLVRGNANQVSISLNDLFKYSFILPPLPEQKKIAQILSTWDKAITTTEQLLANSQQQKKALMQQLLTGKKRLLDENGVRFSGEWSKVHLKDSAECLDNRRVPLNAEERSKMQGNIPYWGANGVVDYVNKFIFNETIVLLAEDGGYFDEYATRPIANLSYGKSWVNNHAHILRAKANCSNEWLYYSLVHKNILGFVNGGTRAKLNKKDMLMIGLLLPPLDEQKKIVDVLSCADLEINNLENKLEALKQEKKALMQQLLTGKRRVKVDEEAA